MTDMGKKRVLIANRGEIALRIIRACVENDIETVLVVSEADRDSLPAKLADRVVCIGPPQVDKSYLDIPSIITVAMGTQAKAREIGFPVLLKASAGGGGRGMRKVTERKVLKNAFDMAANEAQTAFGDSTLFVERYIGIPDHLVLRFAHGQGNRWR